MKSDIEFTNSNKGIPLYYLHVGLSQKQMHGPGCI